MIKGYFVKIYDSLFSDNRFIDLVIKCGNRHKAMGMCVDAFSLAIKYWTDDENPRSLVPLEAFKNSQLEMLIDVNLAKLENNCVYVRGINKIGEERLQILEIRREIGKKGGLASAKQRQANANQLLTNCSPIGDQNQPEKKRKEKKREEIDNTLVQQVELAYNKYPRKEGKLLGIKAIIKQLTKDPSLLASYLKSVDNYAAICHNSGTDKKYIKLFSTFCNKDCWPDYVETKTPQKKLELKNETNGIQYFRNGVPIN
jgi:hypothetical protein